jgi:hypothetical protein
MKDPRAQGAGQGGTERTKRIKPSLPSRQANHADTIGTDIAADLIGDDLVLPVHPAAELFSLARLGQ